MLKYACNTLSDTHFVSLLFTDDFCVISVIVMDASHTKVIFILLFDVLVYIPDLLNTLASLSQSELFAGTFLSWRKSSSLSLYSRSCRFFVHGRKNPP